MITLILPGYSISNKDWAEETAKRIKVDGQIRPIFWDHWDDSNKEFNKEEKALLLSRHTKGDKVNIIAKSVGILVAAYMLEEIRDQVEKIILCGIPLNDLSEEDKTTLIDAFKNFPSEKIISIQNDKDPHGSFNKVEEFLKKVNLEIKIISKQSSDHNYPYYDEFNNFI